jgi:hypothetical protein
MGLFTGHNNFAGKAALAQAHGHLHAGLAGAQDENSFRHQALFPLQLLMTKAKLTNYNPEHCADRNHDHFQLNSIGRRGSQKSSLHGLSCWNLA